MNCNYWVPDKIKQFSTLVLILMVICLSVVSVEAVEPGNLSITAEGTLGSRAIFHMHPDPMIKNNDHMAMAMVHPDYWHYSIMSDDIKTSLIIIKALQMTVSYYVNARTKHMDGILVQALKDGAKQVVNLGAGYDSRAYRFHLSNPDVIFFEIELPEMVLEKQRRVKNVLGSLPEYVNYVPIDFNKQTIPEELTKAGYRPDVKTLFIWEGVTMYISEEAVAGTLDFIATQSSSGSSVVFDYMPLGAVNKDFRTYPDIRGLSFWVAYKGEPFTFGIKEGTYHEFASLRGLTVLSDLGPEELTSRYLIQSDGIPIGRSSSGFRIMHAAVP